MSAAFQAEEEAVLKSIQDLGSSPRTSSTCSGTFCNTLSYGFDSTLSDSSSDLDIDLEIADEVVTVFDWDDTLLPTWYVKSVVEPCLGGETSVGPESPFHEALHTHAALVEETLRAARAFGHVAIVTLSSQGWVFKSAARFLPGLDMQRLVDELAIPVLAIGRAIRSRQAISESLAEGVDLLEVCRAAAMEACLRKICRRREVRLNVISVSDQEAGSLEQEALREVLWCPRRSRLPLLQHLCKTVKFVEEPSLVELGCQLKVLNFWHPAMAGHTQDFDLDLSEGCK